MRNWRKSWNKFTSFQRSTKWLSKITWTVALDHVRLALPPTTCSISQLLWWGWNMWCFNISWRTCPRADIENWPHAQASVTAPARQTGSSGQCTCPLIGRGQQITPQTQKGLDWTHRPIVTSLVSWVGGPWSPAGMGQVLVSTPFTLSMSPATRLEITATADAMASQSMAGLGGGRFLSQWLLRLGPIQNHVGWGQWSLELGR